MFIKYWLPVIIYAIFIFLISSFPGKDIPGLFVGQDIVFHLVEYALFAWLSARAAAATYWPGSAKAPGIFWVFLALVLFALGDEFHQSFVSGRNASVFDISIDTLGVFFGLLIRKIYGKSKALPGSNL